MSPTAHNSLAAILFGSATLHFLAGCGAQSDSAKYDYKHVSYEPKITATTKEVVVKALMVPVEVGKEIPIQFHQSLFEKDQLAVRGDAVWQLPLAPEKKSARMAATFVGFDQSGKRVTYARGVKSVKCDKQSIQFEIILVAPAKAGTYLLEITCDQFLLAKGTIQILSAPNARR